MILVSNDLLDGIFAPKSGPSAIELQRYHNIIKYYPAYTLKELAETSQSRCFGKGGTARVQ